MVTVQQEGALGPDAVPATPRHRHGGLQNTVLAILLVVAGVAALVATARTYLPFVSDDALISYRYSERLLEGRGLTYNDNERVEGYSNLLWVLVVAAGGLLSSNLVLVGRVAGTISIAAGMAALVRAGGRATAQQLIPVAAGIALLAASHGLAIWSIGGLETGLLAGVLAWALVLSVDEPEHFSPTVTGALLALLVLTRPDGILVAALVAGGVLVSAWSTLDRLSAVARLAAVPAAAWLGQLAFRLAFYHDWWPNPAYVKVSFSVHHLSDGLNYLRGAASAHLPVIALALLVVTTARPLRQRRVVVPVVVAVGWIAYVAAIGGDIFPGWRHFTPALICCVVAVVAAWRSSLLSRMPWWLQLAGLAAVCAWYEPRQRLNPENVRARQELWEWECGQMASVLREALLDTAPLIAVDPAGCTGYFSKLPVIDMLGLNDRHIARVRPADWGRGWIGHELGDGRYVLSRWPDLVLLCQPGGSLTGCFRSGKEPVAMNEFHEAYVPVTVAPAGARYPTLVWARVTSKRLGFELNLGRVRVPGLLFARDGAEAVLVDRRLSAKLSPAATVRLPKVPLGGASWKASAHVSAGAATVQVAGDAITVTAGPDGAQLDEVILTGAS
jgi:hypothetical protein